MLVIIATNGSDAPAVAPSSPPSGKLDIPTDFAQDDASNPVSVDLSHVQAAQDAKNIVRRKLTGYVGFANLPNQWHRKSVRKGFNFNVMVVGKFFQFSFCIFLCN